MVDEVKRLGTELKTSLLVNRERLEQPKIPVLKSRLVDQVAHALRVEGARGRLRENLTAIKIGSGEPLPTRPKRTDDPRHTIDDPVLAVIAATEIRVEAHAGIVIIRGRCATRQTRLELCDPADLPPPQQFSR